MEQNHCILVAGSGQIGQAVSQILSQPHIGFLVIVADILTEPPHQLLMHETLRYICIDFKNRKDIAQLVEKYDITAIISCLPYFLNISLAKTARALNLHYFDLTEDVHTTETISKIAKGSEQAFVPQCGIAPGFINIVADDLMQAFSELDTVKLRCGALPQQSMNSLHYALTWSIDGLINEYGNLCAAIVNRKLHWEPPLTALETVQLDGIFYEAFNTSGGLGSLPSRYAGKVNFLNYKTLRYPGHWSKMYFLMNELQLNNDRDTLKRILLKVLPYTEQDVVVMNVSVQGVKNGRLTQAGYFKKFYPFTINGVLFTAIQMTTASAVCVALDIVLQNPEKYQGFVHQTDFNLIEFLNNRFGVYLRLDRL